jgi:hypothetical protein
MVTVAEYLAKLKEYEVAQQEDIDCEHTYHVTRVKVNDLNFEIEQMKQALFGDLLKKHQKAEDKLRRKYDKDSVTMGVKQRLERDNLRNVYISAVKKLEAEYDETCANLLAQAKT